MGSSLYSRQDLQMVQLANRLINAERKRQDIGGRTATEAGKIALHSAERELARSYGENEQVQNLSLSGVTDERQIKKILGAAERITGSKMLTVGGRKEAYEKGMAKFFEVEERGTPLTYEERQIYDVLTRNIEGEGRPEGATGDYTLFDKLKEFVGGYDVGSIKDAVQKMVEKDISSEDITEALKNYIEENALRVEAEKESIYDYLATHYPDMKWK